MKTAIATAPSNHFKRADYIAGFSFLALLIFGIALPAALLIWQANTPQVAIRTGDVGSFISGADKAASCKAS